MSRPPELRLFRDELIVDNFAGGGGGAFFNAGGQAGAADGLLGDVNVAVSAEIFLYAIAIAIGLALLATVVPAWYVGRVRPAEVLRHE